MAIASSVLTNWKGWRWAAAFLLSLLLTVCAAPALSQLPSQPSALQTTELQTAEQIDQGRSLYSRGQFDEAILLWQQAAADYQQQGDNLRQAMALTYLALAYQQLADWTAAETAIATSIQLLSAAAESELQDSELHSQLYAQALTARGQLELALGRSEAALETWQQAGEIYGQRGDRTGVTGSLINQAQAMEALGFYRRSCQALLTALQLENNCDLASPEAFDLILQTFTAQPDEPLRALGLRSLGNILQLMGNLDESQQILHSLIAQHPATQTDSLTLLSLGKTEQALYDRARELSRRTQARDRTQAEHHAEAALEHYRQTVAIAAQSAAGTLLQVQAELQQVSLLLDWAQWLVAGDRRAEAEPLLDQVQGLAADLNRKQADLPASRTAIYAQLRFIESLLQLQQLQPTEGLVDSVEAATAALHQANALQDQRAISYAYGTLGKLYEFGQETQQRQPDGLAAVTWAEARAYTESALSVAQAMQAWDLAYQWQWQLGRLYRQQGEMERAIAAYSATVETLKLVRADLLTVDAEIQFSFRDNVEPVYRQFVDLLLSADGAIAPSQDNLRQAVRQIDALQLSELENFLRCALSSSVELDQNTVDPTAAIIYPIILENRLAVILKLPQSDRLQFHTVSLTQAETNETLTSLRQQLENRYVSRLGLALSQQVYDWLIRPIQADLEANGIKTLVFLLDGGFRNLPMAALHDGQQYLVELYAIALTPSLQLIEPRPLQAQRLSVLAAGLTESRQGFPSLPNVATELAQIQAELPTQQILDRDFTVATLRRLTASLNSPIIHLATHGQFSSDPKETFILAWDQRIGVTDLSNLLRSREQQPAIELLVLSACKTADGDSRATLGLAGVAIQSGARSTLASLWSIDDRATAELIGQFYRALQPLTTKAEALRQAQLNLLRQGYAAPVYWAPYVLVGNWL